MAGTRLGRIDPAEGRQPARPERGRGLLDVGLELLQHRLHRAHDEGQRDEGQREEDRALGVGDVDPDRALRTVEGQQHQAGDDRRQRERDVDEDVEDRALPQNRSRTSTQAMAVPMTTLSAVTWADWSTVSLTAARVWGLVRVSTKLCQPPAAAGGQDGRQRDEDEQARTTPAPRPGPARWARRAWWPARRGRRRAAPPPQEVDRGWWSSPVAPVSAWILVTMPASSSKNLSSASRPATEVLADGEQRLRASGTGRPGRWRPSTSSLAARCPRRRVGSRTSAEDLLGLVGARGSPATRWPTRRPPR